MQNKAHVASLVIPLEFVRIVLDTASFVTAVRSSGGAAGEILRLVFRGELVPLMDLKLGLEYRQVALRPEHLAVSKLTGPEILELIAAIEAFAEPIEVKFKVRPLSIDPNDNMVLDIAINGNADALVTSNTKHFAAITSTFGILVLPPAQLLTRMRRRTKDAK